MQIYIALWTVCAIATGEPHSRPPPFRYIYLSISIYLSLSVYLSVSLYIYLSISLDCVRHRNRGTAIEAASISIRIYLSISIYLFIYSSLELTLRVNPTSLELTLPPTLTSARPHTREWEVVRTVAAPASIVVKGALCT